MKQVSLSKFTNICKTLQHEQEMETMQPSGSSVEISSTVDITRGGVAIRAPFDVRPVIPKQPRLVFHNNVWKTSNELIVELNRAPDVRPLTNKFPVSAGLQHKATAETREGELGGREDGASSSNVFGNQKVSICAFH